MKGTPWIEREFHFDLPIGVFPCIVERLRGTPARLEEMVAALPTRILTLRLNDGWSIQEHIGHLYDLDELHEGRLDDFKAHLKVLRSADMTNRKTYEANHNAESMQSLLASFSEARKHFVERLEDLDKELLSVTAIHPRLQKPMRVIDMAFFVAEHDDHHLATITELSRKLNLTS